MITDTMQVRCCVREAEPPLDDVWSLGSFALQGCNNKLHPFSLSYSHHAEVLLHIGTTCEYFYYYCINAM